MPVIVAFPAVTQDIHTLKGSTQDLATKVSSLNASTNYISTNVVWRDGRSSFVQNVNFGGSNAINIGRVQLNAGVVSSNSILSSEDTSGTCSLKVFPKIVANRTTGKNYVKETTQMLNCDNVISSSGGSYNGFEWTPGVVGFGICEAFISMTEPPQTGLLRVYLNRNKSIYSAGRPDRYSACTYPDASIVAVFYNDNATNIWDVSLWHNFSGGCTNQNYYNCRMSLYMLP
jgi:hypothetical protein